MRGWQQTTMAFSLTLIATPTVAQDKFELPLSSLRDGNIVSQHDGDSMKMSFGSVGLDSNAGDSRRHQYFNIPEERSFKKVPGVWFRIPLGS